MINTMPKIFFTAGLFLVFNSNVMAQKSTIQQFMNLPYPEKIWVCFHPFVASKALRIGIYARDYSLKMKDDPDLDGDYNGGQVDAFRHAFWMALLSKEIGSRSARWLGKAHEKGNEIQFKKKLLEDGSLPDFTTCEMDLKNNEIGIEINDEYPDAERDDLANIIKQYIIEGRMFIIKKDQAGRFLNSTGKVIPDSLHLGLWHNPKTLVASDFERPKLP